MASIRNENVMFSPSATSRPTDEVTIEIDAQRNDPSIQPLIGVSAETFPDIKIYDSIEEFNQNLPETVTLLHTPNGNNVYLVGTAHFSESSQKDVANVIRNVNPRVVVVELCDSRVHILRHDEKTLLEEAKDINIQKIRNVIKSNGFFNGMFYILLLNMSAKLTKELGMAPGGEFRTAMKEAKKIRNCSVHLGDRPINITLQRAIKGLSLWQTFKLVWKLMSFDENITQAEVEQCKQKDLLEELMKEMAGEFPAFGQVFVNERDIFLCNSLQVASMYAKPMTLAARNAQPINIVGVMGIGHCAGVVRNWQREDLMAEIPKIMTIPQASLSTRIFKNTVKYGTWGMIGFGIYRLTAPHIRKLL
jgi:pheromone shutdown-related protein TraB